MGSLMAIAIGLCIGFSPLGKNPVLKIIVKAITGG